MAVGEPLSFGNQLDEELPREPTLEAVNIHNLAAKNGLVQAKQ